jgi:hypothetical protein
MVHVHVVEDVVADVLERFVAVVDVGEAAVHVFNDGYYVSLQVDSCQSDFHTL